MDPSSMMKSSTIDKPPLEVFVDTSALIALLDPRDQYHKRIQKFLKSLNQPLRCTTTNLILAELLTFFSRQGFLKKTFEFQAGSLKDPNFNVIWIDQALHHEACHLLQKFQDQKLSFADAASFAVMRNNHLTTALAFDDDFIRAGFQTIP